MHSSSSASDALVKLQFNLNLEMPNSGESDSYLDGLETSERALTNQGGRARPSKVYQVAGQINSP
jgi:hypothetical protein